ncbi:hypothetical protein Q1695_005968 [Nippostrongylus brasiliensis]|nr:hypothetical protein Q1695_005968 [Nippostrongylus brasiliensis]
MGQFASFHKKDGKNTANTSSAEGTTAPVARTSHDQFISKYADIMKRKGFLPEIFLVHETTSSQYIDEDGDVAHEFYAEQKSQDGKFRRLHRVMYNLRPKMKKIDIKNRHEDRRTFGQVSLVPIHLGSERYAIPRLSPDLPVVIWEVQQQS